jgi:hypothetical protein
VLAAPSSRHDELVGDRFRPASLGVAAVILVAVASSAFGATSRTNATPFTYVALGDSFSAGEGVAPYLRDGFDPATGRQGVIDNRCHRSSRAYPNWARPTGYGRTLYAIASGGGKPGSLRGKNKYGSEKNVRAAGGVEWASWACSGATTENVLPRRLGGTPRTGAGPTVDPRTQLDSADLSGADLVTLTIGGNDVGFAGGLVVCALTNCATQAYERRRMAVIDETRPALEAVYRAVARQAPRARILVLGYPQLFPATRAEQSCPGLRLFSGEQAMLRRLGSHLNDTIEASVEAVARSGAKVEYVPVAARFAGHEVCGRKGPWINGIDTAPGSSADGAFHPTLEGQQDGYAAALNAALKTGRR